MSIGLKNGTVLLGIVYGCDSWSVTLRVEHMGLRLLEKLGLSRISEPKAEEIKRGRENYNMRHFIIYVLHLYFFKIKGHLIG
jgi:hypothetical protein